LAVVDFEISFIDDGQIAVVKASGRATLEEISATMEASTSDPRWRAGMAVLADYNELDLSGLSSQEIENLTSGHFTQANVASDEVAGRFAIVGSTPAKFGLGRKFEISAEDVLPFRVRVFSTTDDALAWLREERATARQQD
jgi:hypothetical protein